MRQELNGRKVGFGSKIINAFGSQSVTQVEAVSLSRSSTVSSQGNSHSAAVHTALESTWLIADIPIFMIIRKFNLILNLENLKY